MQHLAAIEAGIGHHLFETAVETDLALFVAPMPAALMLSPTFNYQTLWPLKLIGKLGDYAS